MIGNIIDDKNIQDKVGYACYDIVVANILADVLVELTPVVVNQMKPGGIYITSGIIDDKEQTVVDAVTAGGAGSLKRHIPGRMGLCDGQKAGVIIERVRNDHAAVFCRPFHDQGGAGSVWKARMSII